MSLLAPTLEAFFVERLAGQRQASPHTIASYRDTFRLLLGFVEKRTGIEPSRLDLGDLEAPTIGAFLDHLERERGSSIQTRNARLAAIRSLFRFAALRHPEHAALIQRVLAIPQKRFERHDVSFLTVEEAEALISAPDRSTWTGRRDRVILALAIQTGLRASELTDIRRADLELGRGAYVTCRGKGRRARSTPLTASMARLLREWLREVADHPDGPLFPGPRGGPLSRDGIRRLVERHVRTAEQRCPSLRDKTVTAHVLRHTCAMTLLGNGVDVAVIALWLGHQDIRTTQQIYLHADMALKERALAATNQPGVGRRVKRFRAPDSLMSFLASL
jgi:site-specific recombinase XerD